MSPAKKQPAKKKPAPAKAPVVVPPPVLTKPQERFWKVVQTKNLIGGTMFLLGVGFCIGFWVSDKAHGIEKVVLGVGVFLIIAGAHFVSSEPTERFLKAAVSTVKGVRPKDDAPPGDG
jgi:hypothetical protein